MCSELIYRLAPFVCGQGAILLCGSCTKCNTRWPCIIVSWVCGRIQHIFCDTLHISLLQSTTFYRTMLKDSACCWPVSVCSSVTLVYCMQVAKDIIRLLRRPGSPIILAFFSPITITQFIGEPTHWECWVHGVGIICDFQLKSPFILERYEIGPWLLWNVNKL